MTGSRAGGGAVGVMGGTFDPIHVGHLAVAEEAREALGLEAVLFVPAGVPPHKSIGGVSSVEHRVGMVELAIADNPAFRLSRVEVDRAGPSWTVDTLELLRQAHPELVLILSAETLAGLPGWHDPARLFALAQVAIVPRPGHEPPDDAWLDRHFPGARSRVTRLDGPRLMLSSTAIRDRVAARRSIRYLVPDAVARYIGDHGLYQTGSTPYRPQHQEALA